jgi:hypothetical protein
MATKNAETIHALTTAEIGRQTKLYSERLKQVVAEQATIYANTLKNGTSGETPVVDLDERAARDLAKSMLNGFAPPALSLPPPITRDQALCRERRALEIVLKIFSDEDLVARATEAVEWAEAHTDEFRRLAREITFNAVRSDALERHMRQLLEGCGDPSAVRLPMVIIVNSRAISEIPLSDLKAAALAEGIVTAAEMRKLENVE